MVVSEFCIHFKPGGLWGSRKVAKSFRQLDSLGLGGFKLIFLGGGRWGLGTTFFSKHYTWISAVTSLLVTTPFFFETEQKGFRVLECFGSTPHPGCQWQMKVLFGIPRVAETHHEEPFSGSDCMTQCQSSRGIDPSAQKEA